MKNWKKILAVLCFPLICHAQTADSSALPEPKAAPRATRLRFNLSDDGSRYLQLAFLNQVWLRYNESNPGTTRFSKPAAHTFDIGLRRTRLQLFGQVADRAFVYFQFGQNNYNNAVNYTGNRKLSAFFHDAVCEFTVLKPNALKVGAGLTIANGLSRFSQPSVSSIMTLDVPVFLQYSVDQTDQFDRRLAVYARGQTGKLDYRFYLSNPFPVSSSGTTPPPPGPDATFVNVAAIPPGTGPGIHHQLGTYLAWNFFENEPHLTPYMTGTYLGTKKIWNIGIGGVYQRDATWYLDGASATAGTDTVYADMLLLSLESYLDIPLPGKGRALSAFAGAYKTDYGRDYLRFNGQMNPATGSLSGSMLHSTAFGNAYPMFGTGNVVYIQAGYLFPLPGVVDKGSLMPYFSTQQAGFDKLRGLPMRVYSAGVNWLPEGHHAKISLEYQNRPTYEARSAQDIANGPRKHAVLLQFQISL